jgi:hypothetical protein
MGPFWQDVVKIVIDKALLGSIALTLGFYFSRRLEDYRSGRAHDLTMHIRGMDTIREALQIVSAFHTQLEAAVRVVHQALDRRPESLSEEELQPAYKYIREYEDFGSKLKSLIPLLPFDICQACSSYLDLVGRLKSVVLEEPGALLPSQNELNQPFVLFLNACAKKIREEP